MERLSHVIWHTVMKNHLCHSNDLLYVHAVKLTKLSTSLYTSETIIGGEMSIISIHIPLMIPSCQRVDDGKGSLNEINIYNCQRILI